VKQCETIEVTASLQGRSYSSAEWRRIDDLDSQARAHMLEGTRQWLECRDPAPSFRAAARAWRKAGDYGSILRAEIAEREAEKG
jgi:transposase